ncbi:MAG TPA: hypothetical protein VHI93_03445 [Candidatus Thermoplasmatota archaeon]|nr:hypothetical protein [Candidatus Thermoplasmatota archaeon]
MDSDWGMACSDCGSRFYRSELPTGRSFTDKLAVHKEMGCNVLGEQPGPI